MDPTKGEKNMKKMKVKALVSIAMLSSIAYILMLLNFPIPPFPNFLKIDFSDIPALIGTLIFGPMAGVLIELFKNIVYNSYCTKESSRKVENHVTLCKRNQT